MSAAATEHLRAAAVGVNDLVQRELVIGVEVSAESRHRPGGILEVGFVLWRNGVEGDLHVMLPIAGGKVEVLAIGKAPHPGWPGEFFAFVGHFLRVEEIVGVQPRSWNWRRRS